MVESGILAICWTVFSTVCSAVHTESVLIAYCGAEGEDALNDAAVKVQNLKRMTDLLLSPHEEETLVREMFLEMQSPTYSRLATCLTFVLLRQAFSFLSSSSSPSLLSFYPA